MKTTSYSAPSVKGIFVVVVLLMQSGWQLAIANDNSLNNLLTVDQAYQSIPHRRTEYSTTESSQTKEVSAYLKALFEATDYMFVERIRGLKGAYNKDRYQNGIDLLTSINPPKSAENAHQLILVAVSEHQQYYESEMQGSNLVQSSHQRLIQAYNILMSNFPDNPRNQQAYFDHLCALDFI